jgi:phosphate:Na+ symporter
VASVLYLFKSRVVHGSGKALAGFSLIFLGIGYLQGGLSGARDLIDLSGFDAGGISGRLVLLLIGGLLTLITQSSSATVAAGLTALNTGLIDLPQAAAVIIGADVGTTATAALATIGGNTGSRRTGFAHVIYNLLTGIGAFLFLPGYFLLANRFAADMVVNSPEVVAVAFHSIFNAVGVLVALPFTYHFARLIERLFPEQEEPLVAALDERLLVDPNAAMGALTASGRAIAIAVLRSAASRLSAGELPAPEESSAEMLSAIVEARSFAARTGEIANANNVETTRLFSLLHMIDHTERLAERNAEDGRFEEMATRDDLLEVARKVASDFAALADDIATPGPITLLSTLETTASDLEADESQFRRNLIESATRGEVSGDALDEALDGARWLRRLVYHAWRLAHYWEEFESGTP